MTEVKQPVLLSGGNPQIAKADGDVPVQAWISAAPGWKHEVARELDALVVRTLPGVRKAVKWNSPLYGVDCKSWFLGMHCTNRYLKLAFFNGGALEPAPPVASKDPKVRYLHIYEDEAFDEAQLAEWLRQAAGLPGWIP